ncbi:hypothetical protein ACFSX5_14050 [Devosia albogilva]|uniref:Uncharacterized protein n=1 Tax=Devosia albogilva TaxID=429726 RepID=A0ABW5QMM3_9HYPH
MIVYGDSERVARPVEVVAKIRHELETYLAHPDGLPAHSGLVGAFIATAELVQAIADDEMAAAGGIDIAGFGQNAGKHLLMMLAGQIAASWRNHFQPEHRLPPAWQDLLARLAIDTPMRLRQGEGYLHYALYPEGYVDAALRSGLGPDTCVIGLRSIGTGLAALVAAGLGADNFFTLRPVGHPFDRRIAPAEPLARDILAAAGPYAIVDEGPGKSGSSFGGVADWLEANGVARDRIHFFPSHGGEPGDQASAEQLTRWRSASRHVSGLSSQHLAEHLSRWLPDLIGPLDTPLQEISGGGWRQSSGGAPPADRQMEKLKFRADAGGQLYLVKFAGVGPSGSRKLEQAQALFEDGHVPEPIGLAHGFLVERWIDGRTLWTAEFDRGRFLDHAGAYLGTRARLLPATTAGASLAQLADMAAINLGERLGTPAEQAVRTHMNSAADHKVSPVFTDNRLQLWEWLVRRDGSFVKTDALDHATGHDLIGPQDIAWDVAGFVAEFDLTADELPRLLRVVSATADRKVDPHLVDLLLPCYLAFQIGLWTDALTRADGEDPQRIAALLDRYANKAARLLAVNVD